MASPTVPMVIQGAAASRIGAPLKRRSNYNADLGLADEHATTHPTRALVASLAHLQPPVPVMTPQERARQPEKLQLVAFTAEMWAACIGMICDGVPCAQAVKQAGIPTTVLEGYIRTDVRIRSQWEEAKLTALRRHWPLALVEEILDEIAEGSSVRKAVQTTRKLSYVSFLKLTQSDPIIEEMYLHAKRLQAETFADEIVDESQQDNDDMDITGKGNIAAVNRSKLRVSTKQWLMQANSPKRFRKEAAPQVNVQVNVDHANRLEEARRRKEGAVQEQPIAMNVQFSNLPSAAKPEWDDL